MDKETGTYGLQATERRKMRNPAIEICRLVASIFVVFIHYGFPGEFGEVMNCLARFAVPFFFAVSGYFAYQKDEVVIKKRTIGILKLNLHATLLYLLWGSYEERYVFGRGRAAWLQRVFSEGNLTKWFINGVNPLAGHLWYLAAILECYIMLYLYVRWKGKKYDYYSLYVVSILLYAVHVMMGSVAAAVDFDVPYKIYRNALFTGIPMFSLGIFLREYGDKILETYRLSRKKLVMLIVLGAAFSVLQWRGTGKVEMPVGSVIEVVALMLLIVSLPANWGTGKVIAGVTSGLGVLSTYIYVTHIFWMDLYEIFWRKYITVLEKTALEYLSPVLVVLISVCTGVVYIMMKGMVEKAFTRLLHSFKKT